MTTGEERVLREGPNKCSGTQGNAVPHIQFMAQASKLSPTSDRYNARARDHGQGAQTWMYRFPTSDFAF